MKIIRAKHLGMCFGVRDAIAQALDTARIEPLTILGDLVHNETVLAQLRASGIRIAQHAGEVATPLAMVTAHGASEQAKQRARDRGLNLREATCPLVRVAHRAVAKLAQDGFHPVIIGKREHVEVRGLTEDLDDYDVVLSEQDVADLRERPRFGIAAQTTQPIDKVLRLVGLLRERFARSEVRFIDTVCQPTKQRQTAAIELALRADVVVVIGGVHSNNTRELVATCSQFCPQVHHIQVASEICPEWFALAGIVGITAGTSTPDEVIAEVESRIEAIANGREMGVPLSAELEPVRGLMSRANQEKTPAGACMAVITTAK